MATISKTKTWTDNENVTYTDLNGNFDTVYNEINGSLSNANIDASAAIAESKITFSGTGHGHTGGTDGKEITKNRGYGFYVAGTPSVANDLSWNPRVYYAQTAVRISAHAKTAPTGADLIVRIYNVTQAEVTATVTISASGTDATSTSITNSALTAGDILRADVTQVGSTIAGADISIQLDVTE